MKPAICCFTPTVELGSHLQTGEGGGAEAVWRWESEAVQRLEMV